MRQAEMTPANVHDSRLGEALIQGDEQGYFADEGLPTARLCARRSNDARPGRWDRLEGQARPLSARALLQKAPQRLGGKRALRRVERAPSPPMKRWYGMDRGRYLGLALQRLPPAVRRHGDEHETAGARAYARCWIRSQERSLRRAPESVKNRWPNGKNLLPHPTETPSSRPQPIAPRNSSPFCEALGHD